MSCNSVENLLESTTHTPGPSEPSPQDLAQEFSSLVETHVYSTQMKRVIASFDLEALKAQATRSMGKKCTGCSPISQGGFNTVFILTFEDGSDIIARLNGSAIAQDENFPVEDVTQRFVSEVATLRYVKQHTSIPVPKVYYAESDFDNPVRTRYMLMERISGQSLTAPWNKLSAEGRRKVVAQLADLQSQLLKLEFSNIGCLIDEAGTVGPLGLSCTYPFVLRDDNRGPFASSKEFLLAHVRSELDLLMNHTDEWNQQRTKWAFLNGGFDDIPRQYAIKWFQLLLDGINSLPLELLDPPENAFVLFHDDFDTGNILVSHNDPTEVVGILDWEGSRILPLWDPRRLCSVIASPSDIEDPEEYASLKSLQKDILQDAQLYIGYSQLHLARLLHIVDYGHSVQSKRTELDALFIQWFDGVCATGRSQHIESFLDLKRLIQSSGNVETPMPE
ncbi:kinase-like domain-containing protein [Mycena galericulata]|nr:kinase-like domain-containing protein [Mycena galericulata]